MPLTYDPSPASLSFLAASAGLFAAAGLLALVRKPRASVRLPRRPTPSREPPPNAFLPDEFPAYARRRVIRRPPAR